MIYYLKLCSHAVEDMWKGALYTADVYDINMLIAENI